MSTFRIEVPLPQAPNGRGRRKILFEGVYYPERPYRACVFVEQPDADEQTRTEGNWHFAGEFSMTARKYYPENEAQGLVPWSRPAFKGRLDPDQPATIAIDAEDAFGKLGAEETEASVSVVLTDANGRRLPDEFLRFEGIRVAVE